MGNHLQTTDDEGNLISPEDLPLVSTLMDQYPITKPSGL
jgi:hypothetical protein